MDEIEAKERRKAVAAAQQAALGGWEALRYLRSQYMTRQEVRVAQIDDCASLLADATGIPRHEIDHALDLLESFCRCPYCGKLMDLSELNPET